MFPMSHLWLVALTLIGVGLSTPSASAGWVCIKNETKIPLIVQELPDRPTARRGKLVKLLPGEIYREYHRTAGERKVRIFDARTPGKPLGQGKLIWKSADVMLRIELADHVARLVPASHQKPTAPMIVQAGSAQEKR
jgi:hypothetical protein